MGQRHSKWVRASSKRRNQKRPVFAFFKTQTYGVFLSSEIFQLERHFWVIIEFEIIVKERNCNVKKNIKTDAKKNLETSSKFRY